MDLKALQSILADFDAKEFGMDAIIDELADRIGRSSCDYTFAGFVAEGVCVIDTRYEGRAIIDWQELEELRTAAERKAKQKTSEDRLREETKNAIHAEKERIRPLRREAGAEIDAIWAKILRTQEGMKYENNKAFFQVQVDALISKAEAKTAAYKARFNLNGLGYDGEDIAKLQAYCQRLSEIR